MALCERVQQAGYVPIAIGGDAQAYWAGEMGWLVRLLGDAYLRNYVPMLMAQSGDWDYEQARNGDYQYRPNDLYSDMLVVVNREREFAAMRRGELDFRAPKFRRIYERLGELAQYFQPGYMGADARSATQLFYTQKAAMCLMHSGSITGIVHDFAKMKPEERFEFANFWFPPITDDPLVEGPFRGVGGGGMVLAVMQKNDPVHEQNVVDFLQFLTTPESGRLLVERTLADGQPLTGPLLIEGVDLPPELADKFDVFRGHGYEKINYRGVGDEQESVQEWVIIAQEYMGGRLSMDDFLQRYNELMLRGVDRLVRRDGLDMDPTTEDEPPIVHREKNPWNPFENGSLMLVLITTAFAVFAWMQVRVLKDRPNTERGPRICCFFPRYSYSQHSTIFPPCQGCITPLPSGSRGVIRYLMGWITFVSSYRRHALRRFWQYANIALRCADKSYDSAFSRRRVDSVFGWRPHPLRISNGFSTPHGGAGAGRRSHLAADLQSGYGVAESSAGHAEFVCVCRQLAGRSRIGFRSDYRYGLPVDWSFWSAHLSGRPDGHIPRYLQRLYHRINEYA